MGMDRSRLLCAHFWIGLRVLHERGSILIDCLIVLLHELLVRLHDELILFRVLRDCKRLLQPLLCLLEILFKDLFIWCTSHIRLLVSCFTFLSISRFESLEKLGWEVTFVDIRTRMANTHRDMGNVEAAIAEYKKLGATVVEVSLPNSQAAMPVSTRLGVPNRLAKRCTQNISSTKAPPPGAPHAASARRSPQPMRH